MRGAPSFHVCWQVRHWLPQPAQDGRQHPRGAAGPDRGQGGCQQAGRLPAGWAGVLRSWWQPRGSARCALPRLSTGNYRRAYQHAVELAAFTGLDLHGPHDLRSTYATLLEAGSVPARVIDELMGHRAGGRGQLDAATVGAHYRHTTPAMLGLVVETVEAYLHTALGLVPQTCPKDT
jgi:Phage integrase family